MILSIGEILVDLIGKNDNGKITYTRFPGGAPFNVACGIAKFGGKVSFIGNVGEDLFGDFLLDFSKNLNFENVLISKDKMHNTTLAIIENNEYGERSFSFYRKDTADYNISKKHLMEIKNSNIIHFGSLMLSEEKGRKIADSIISLAKKYNKILSFDINYRDDIFKNQEEAINIYKHYYSQVDILKFSLEEILFFSGKDNYQEALEVIGRNDQMIFLTLGKDGSVYYKNGKKTYMKSISVNPVDTTGAGDAFFAAVLTNIDEHLSNLDNLEIIKKTLRFANVAGALVTTDYGAIDSLPSIDKITSLL